MAGDKSTFKKFHNQVSQLASKLRAQFYARKVEQLHETNQHSWWKHVRNFLNLKSQSPFSLLDVPNNTKPLPDIINDFFTSVSDDLEPVKPEVLCTLSDDYCSQYIIHAQDVERRLSKINIHKAAGPDFFPSWILRDFVPLLAEPLAAIYNASVREGIVPHIWKFAIVVPVPKVHPPKSISTDLRPNSLLPVLAKD